MTTGAGGIFGKSSTSVGNIFLFIIISCNHVSAETLFAKRLKEAVPMRSKHQDLFAKFSATFKPETVSVWEEMVTTWERDNTQPNPYEEPVNGEFCHS
jgi:hypothetical protein